ncbi:MAG: FtsX-like permease family protein, partial [Bryobacteraceae bacterium]
AKPTYYVPYEPSVAGAQRIRQASFFVRADSGFDALPGVVRAALAQLDRALPVFELRPMELQVEDSVYTERLIAALSTAFGLLALVLTAVGLYGVIAYMVTRRTAEIGIRMALGATRRNGLSLVMREVVLLTVAGVEAGMLGAVAAGRAIQTLLFGVGGADWEVFTVAPAVLAAVALCAGLLPALRASRIEPLEALRHD